MRRVASDNTRDGGGHGSKSEITLGSKLIKRRDLVPHGSWVSTYLDILISYSEIPSLTPRPNSTANAPFYLDPSGSKIAASSSGYILPFRLHVLGADGSGARRVSEEMCFEFRSAPLRDFVRA
jgi:hypothetical protein